MHAGAVHLHELLVSGGQSGKSEVPEPVSERVPTHGVNLFPLYIVYCACMCAHILLTVHAQYSCTNSKTFVHAGFLLSDAVIICKMLDWLCFGAPLAFTDIHCCTVHTNVSIHTSTIHMHIACVICVIPACM